MRMLSYRGPSAPGGVSNALTQIFDKFLHHCDWFYVKDTDLVLRSHHRPGSAFALDEDLIEGHYRYCNDFLWPILHDMPEKAHYDAADRRAYQSFNMAVGFQLRADRGRREFGCFINDYQFALVPNVLRSSCDNFIFWHIPWPASVRDEYVEPMRDLALGLLHANVVGFHTEEYLLNFFDFVERHLPHFSINRRQNSIAQGSDSFQSRNTDFVVAPLGVDLDFWQSHAALGCLHQSVPAPQDLPYVLSVDRADFTKGIRERLEAIDRFFIDYPQWIGKMRFIQLGARSRPGLVEFDRYWDECAALTDRINDTHATSGWQPLVWTATPHSPSELAGLYNRASVMLVNPLRDGLNLTAKEFAACQNARGRGVLTLSKGAGVYHEIGRHCGQIQSLSPCDIAAAVHDSLVLAPAEIARRKRLIHEALSENTLEMWWRKFENACKSSDLHVRYDRVVS